MCDQPLNAGDWNHTYNAINWMKEAAHSPRPFMLYLTTGLVHPAFNADKRQMDRIDENAIEIPPGLGDVSAASHPADQYSRISKNCDKEFSEKMVREIRHTYYAMIAALDDIVGRVISAIDDLGLRESTYIVFSSDHGEMAGEQNQILKRTMYEPSVHEPLIISGPGLRKSAKVDTPVSLIDLYPTFMDMAELNYADVAGQNPAFPESLDGESLMPLLQSADGSRERDWTMTQYNGDRSCTGTFMLRRGKWKYVKYIGLPPQLFDLEEDPWERNNRADSAKEVVKEMDTILTEHFDCEGIDAQAKQYDKDQFTAWRNEQKKNGDYEDTMARIYSGFDRMSIEDITPWYAEDEKRIDAWLSQ